jgi:hypothetical protein
VTPPPPAHLPQAPLSCLIPRPQWHRIDGPPAVGSENTITASADPSSEQWQQLATFSPEELPPEGYVLSVDRAGNVTVAAADDGGLRHAESTLTQLRNHYGADLPQLTIRDWPHLPRRGTIEGFYGPPWSHEVRLDHLRFAASVKLNSYVYAPKDDEYHRRLWREPYPEDGLAQLCELAATAAALGIDFTYALAPGLSMRYSDPAEHAALQAKARQLWEAGIRSFALLFDDVPTEFTHAEDAEHYGSGPGATGEAHGEVTARFQQEFLAPRGATRPIVVAPSDYAGTQVTPYRSRLAKTLPVDALVWWTGSDIVVGGISREDIDAAATSYQRGLVLWDNFPVNDFDPGRLFLGPLTGRTCELEGAAVLGLSANPMIQGSASKFSLATAADWAWNPAHYAPGESGERSRAVVGGQDAARLRPLIRVNSSWPPSAPQDPELETLIPEALAGSPAALGALRQRFAELAGSPVRLESALLEDDLLRAGLAAHEGHYANVLRPAVAAFVRKVIGVIDEASGRQPGRRRVAVLADGAGPGEEHLLSLLEALGLDSCATPGDPDVRLTIVTRTADAAAARAAAGSAQPVLAWGHLDELSLAHTKGILFAQEAVEVLQPEHALSAGFRGRVEVYRGPGKLTWCEPASGAAVIARAAGPDSEGRPPRPVISYYPAGSILTDGMPVPAERVAYFLGPEGAAPWLMTGPGRELLAAAVRFLVRSGE